MASILPRNSKQKIDLTQLTKELFIKGIKEARILTGPNIESSKFNKYRCKLLSETETVKENCNGILYWMLRECRVQDNWSLLFAQKLARKNKVPLHVCFFAKPVTQLYPTKRQYNFLMKGLKEVAEELDELNIKFNLVNAHPTEIVNIVKNNNIGAVVCDLFPLRVVNDWITKLCDELPEDVAFIQIDGHNIVPVWHASDKKEIGARTIRRKIVDKLPEFLEGFPNVSKHEYDGKLDIQDLGITHEEAMDHFKSTVDIDEVKWAKPGAEAGLNELHSFITTRLQIYAKDRNDPSKDAQSNLSPWLHFGFIAPQRCALEVQTLKSLYKEGVEVFLEEAVVRRELSDNFCYYNENYDTLEGADDWAKETHKAHSGDKRPKVYSKEQLSEGLSHEEVWNAAQMQLVQEGKLHGYMRMYWCKKILEWTKSPEEAIEIALYLNDYYSLDGSDPNGFVGVMWSVCGVHDHPWMEREIFGKVRFMIEYRLLRKFDAEAYCKKYLRSFSSSAIQQKRKAPPPSATRVGKKTKK